MKNGIKEETFCAAGIQKCFRHKVLKMKPLLNAIKTVQQNVGLHHNIKRFCQKAKDGRCLFQVVHSGYENHANQQVAEENVSGTENKQKEEQQQRCKGSAVTVQVSARVSYILLGTAYAEVIGFSGTEKTVFF